MNHLEMAPYTSQEVLQLPLDRSEASLLSALSASEKRVVAAGEETETYICSSMAAMQAKMNGLFAQIQHLQTQLMAAESREREIKVLYEQKIASLQGEKEASKQEIFALRQKVAETTQKAEARIAAEIAARAEAVRAATQAGEVRVAQAQQETAAARKETEVARQEADQRVAVVGAEKDAAVQATKQADVVQLAAALGERDAIEAQLRHKMNVAEDLANRLQREKNSLIKAMALFLTATEQVIGSDLIVYSGAKELLHPFAKEIKPLILQPWQGYVQL